MAIVVRRTNTHTAVRVLHCQLLLSILSIAHPAVIGAFIKSDNPIDNTNSIWLTSFVVLVIKLLTEKFFTSAVAKSIVFVNTFLRIFFENVVDT